MQTTFTYNKGAVDGPQKSMRMTGFPRKPPDAGIWGMQFIWPIKADYRIMYIDDDYQTSIVGRNKRDYLWIMSRRPQIGAESLEQLITIATAGGYDPDKIRLTNWQIGRSQAFAFDHKPAGSIK